MRKRIWITCTLLLVACVALWLARLEHTKRRRSQDLSLREPAADPSHQPVRGDPRAQQRTNSGTAFPSAAPLTAGAGDANSNGVQAQLLREWQAPIEFYGKTIDENGDPVPGVSVRFRWSEKPTEDGMITADAQSDFEGLFSLQRKRGRSLTIKFEKEGYYSSHNGEATFNYALGPDVISPDPQKPVLFHLHTKGTGEPLIKKEFPVGIGQLAQLRSDGTPVELDLLTGQQALDAAGTLKLELWRDSADKVGSKFGWRCQISAPGGGLIETGQEFALRAPESGYVGVISIDMPTSSQDWKSQIRRKYYIHMGGGKYGIFELSILGWNGVFTVKSAVNPSGSRVLEWGGH
jgi:hypothetical protein